MADSTPFDVLTDRYLPYNIDNLGLIKQKLIETIAATLHGCGDRGCVLTRFDVASVYLTACPLKMKTT